MGKRRSYTKEFKIDAVVLNINSNKTVKEIADDLGINYSNLTRCEKNIEIVVNMPFLVNGKQKLTPEQQKIKDLEDELRETKLERDILKKAVDIFSKKTK